MSDEIWVLDIFPQEYIKYGTFVALPNQKIVQKGEWKRFSISNCNWMYIQKKMKQDQDLGGIINI